MLLLMNRRFAAGFAGLLTILLAACSSGASSTPSVSTAPVVSASASEAAPSVEASASASADASVALPSLPNSDTALEDLLPDELGGQPLQKTSMKGADFLDSGTTDNQDFKDFLQRLGAQPDDISVAIGFALTGDSQNSIFAFRVKGVAQDKLTDEFKTSIEQDSSTKLTWQDETIGGKSVVTTTDPDQGKIYVYPKGDTIFFVTSTDASVAEEALSELP
jgi:hypothetical protein